MAPTPFRMKRRVTEDTVGVIGKSFPSTVQSDYYARYPVLVLVLSLVLPIVFMYYGTNSNVAVDVSLEGFEARPHESTSTAEIVTSAISNWMSTLSGTAVIAGNVDLTRSRSKIAFRQEVRFSVDEAAFEVWYQDVYLPGTTSPEAKDVIRSIFHRNQQSFIQNLERTILTLSDYENLCFANNIKYGTPQATTVQCAPLTTTTQYFYPGTHSTLSNGRISWPFLGQGLYYQFPLSSVTRRFLLNPNYAWYVDKRTSNLNPYPTSTRTQITFGTPFLDPGNGVISAASIGSDVIRVRAFTRRLNKAFVVFRQRHPFVYFQYGGDQVQEALVADALDADIYKLPIMIVIIAVISWLHTRSVILSICIEVQLLIIYLASWGFYITAYDTATSQSASSTSDAPTKALPLLSTITLFLIISFCLHGVLTMYDTFVHSGIMATTGRRNNLSVSQRIAFALRRAGFGITLANGVAIIVLSINTVSAFQAVRDFSVLLIFALLFNIYFTWTVTPAFILFHHYYFSRKRRLAQRQRDIMTDVTEDVTRNNVLSRVLSAIQANLTPEEEPFTDAHVRERILQQAEDIRWRLSIRDSAGSMATDAKREIDELIASMRQNRGKNSETSKNQRPRRVPRGEGGLAGDDGTESEEFQFDAFIDASKEAATKTRQAGGAPWDRYHNSRMVAQDQICHIPLHLTLRDASTKALVCEVARAAQPDRLSTQVLPASNNHQQYNHHRNHGRSMSDVSSIEMQEHGSVVYSQRVPQPEVLGLGPYPSLPELQESDPRMGNEYRAWSNAAERLASDPDAPLSFGATLTAMHPTATTGGMSQLAPLLVHHFCAAHDPYWVVSESNEVSHHVRGGWERNQAQQEGSINGGGGGLVRRRSGPQLTRHQSPLKPPGDRDGQQVTFMPAPPDFDADREPNDERTMDGPIDEQLPTSPTTICETSTPQQLLQQPPMVSGQSNTNTTTAAHRARDRAALENKAYKSIFKKMRYRWKMRHTEERQYCCGMLGRRVDETREERDARILARATKKEGYGRMERFMTQFVAPWIDQHKWLLLLLFVGLLVASIILSTFVQGAGVPTTLITDTTASDQYAAMSTLYATTGFGSCDFCGLYYRPYNTPPSASEADLWTCSSQGYQEQMNLFVDQTGICGGNNANMMCNGQSRLSAAAGDVVSVTSCGTCAATEDACNQCLSTQDCSLCYLRNQTMNRTTAGPSCTKVCPCSSMERGTCNVFSGDCTCTRTDAVGWSGTTCSNCAYGWLGEDCTEECNLPSFNVFPCNCDTTTSRCRGCPTGYRFGLSCNVPKIICQHGYLNASATGCVCDIDYEDGGICQYHRSCSYRGSLYTSSQSIVAGCGCVGNWMGASCSWCACRNGGTCRADGSCACAGTFTGPQCQYCPSNCSFHGQCPSPLNASKVNLRSCLGIACSYAEQDSETPCAPCTSITWVTTPACFYTSQIECNTNVQCYWYNGFCVNISNPTTQTNLAALTTCPCRGAWSGPTCSLCSGPNGSTCTFNGDVQACDGFTYSNGGAGAPAVDVCGVCGGTGNCVGCDGIPNSGLVYDNCGVCGGNDICQTTGAAGGGGLSASPIGVTFFYSIQSVPTNVSAMLDTLAYQCVHSLQVLAATGMFIPPVMCVISDYIQWKTSALGISTTGSSNYGNLTALYQYALDTGRLGDLGFNVADPSSTSLRLLFARVDVTLPILTTADTKDIFKQYQSMLQLAQEQQTSMPARDDSGRFQVYQTSASWANAVSAEVSMSTLKFTSGVGMALFFGIVGAAFANLRVALFATLVLVFVTCGTLAVAYAAEWKMDAISQVCVAGVLATSAEHVIHIIDGYQDYLQSTQSHLFAVSTTRLHAFRGAMTRTGVSIVSSAVAVIAVAIMFTQSEIQPFKRAAQIMITLHILTLLGAVCFGAALCAIGPTRFLRQFEVNVIVCCCCACLGGIAVLIIFLAGGVQGPSGTNVPK